MDPYRYLQRIDEEFDRLQDPQRIEQVLDELEFLYEALDPQLHDLAGDLIERLTQRLRDLRTS